MNLRRPTLPLLLALSCALLLASCGESTKAEYPTKAEYEEEMRGIGDKADRDMKRLEGGSPSEADVEKAAKTLDEVADDFAEVTPPSEVERLHDDLVETVRDLSDGIGALTGAADEGAADPQDLQQLRTASARLTKITADFDEKGYDIGLDPDAR